MRKQSRLSVLAAVVAVALVPLSGVASAAPGDHDAVRDMSWPLGRLVQLSDTYDANRGGNADGCTNGRKHQAVDLMAPKMTKIHAAMGGTVSYLPESQPSYGWIIIIRGDDGLKYSYVHLNNDNPGTDDGNGGIEQAIVDGVRRGARVERGQHIGWVGDSGNAESTGAHLHLDIEDPDQQDSQLECPYEEARINPYPSLVAALERGDVPGSITPIGAAGGSGDGGGDADGAPDADEDPNPPIPTGWTWADVPPDGTHAGAIGTLTAAEVLDGCTETRYCPSDGLQRRDMARFLALGLGLAPAAEQFDDVASDDPDAGWIGAIAAADITTGCGDGSGFCPDGTVTRGEMARFLAIAHGLPDAVPDFDDVDPHSAFGPSIGAILAVGVTNGCDADGTSYCGSDIVRRGEIASFIERAS